MSHHGNDPEAQRAMSEAMKEIFGEFPNGKLNQNDEGALAVVVGHEKNSVVLRFPKPVSWIGFTPEQAIDIAQSLITHARKIGLTVPLVITLGDKP
jgi:hypothetical protein